MWKFNQNEHTSTLSWPGLNHSIDVAVKRSLSVVFHGAYLVLPSLLFFGPSGARPGRPERGRDARPVHVGDDDDARVPAADLGRNAAPLDGQGALREALHRRTRTGTSLRSYLICCRGLLFTGFYRVLPSFTEFYRVLPSFTEFSWLPNKFLLFDLIVKLF